jgi:putative DNA primase/helicase
MSDTEEIYYYNTEKKVYTNGGEILVKIQSEEILPEITTSQVNEIINKIKRKTFVDRSEFDTKHEILNLENGLLNMHTGELKEHSVDHLSLVQLPLKYNPKAKCPLIMKFLAQVLHPRDIFTALQIFGYCLHRSSEYEKAIMLFGNFH